jgi:hypothetical protein
VDDAAIVHETTLVDDLADTSGRGTIECALLCE